MRLQLLLMAAWVSSVALSGCSTQTVTGAEEVKAVDDQYQPNSLSIFENDKVKWTNEGTRAHTVTIHKAGDPITTTKKDTNLDPGASTEFSFTEDGTYHVYCKHHSAGQTGTFNNGMVMTITVKPK